MTTAFPGFDSPAVGFEQPFEMLLACHERVRRSLALLCRLDSYVRDQGHDEQARSAATDVLRYFDLAAPLHHEDEEAHVFPVLVASGDTGLATTVATLHRDHLRMAAFWAALRTTLERWARPGSAGAGAGDVAFRDQVAEFDAMYAAHLRTEEDVVFPAARSRMSDADLVTMSADMQRRRAAPGRP